MSDLMREEFEAAIISEFKSVGCIDGPDLSRSENNGDYLNQVAGGAWWAWHASRECLVIELPELKINGTWHFFGFVRGFRAAKKMMRSLYEIELNKIGVKTK